MVPKRDAANNILTGFLLVALFMTFSSYYMDDMCHLTARSAYYYPIEGFEEKNGFIVKMIDTVRTFFQYIDPVDFQLCNDYGLVVFIHGCHERKENVPETYVMNKDAKLGYLWVYCVEIYHGDKFRQNVIGMRRALETCLIQVNDLLPFLDPCLSTRKMDKYHECFVLPNTTTT